MIKGILLVVAILFLSLLVSGCAPQGMLGSGSDELVTQGIGISQPFAITAIIKADLDYVPAPFGNEIKHSLALYKINGTQVYFVAVQANVAARNGKSDQDFVDALLGSATEIAVMKTPGNESSPDVLIVRVTQRTTDYWVVAIAPQIPLSTGFLYDLKYREIPLYYVPYRAWLYTSRSQLK